MTALPVVKVDHPRGDIDLMAMAVPGLPDPPLPKIKYVQIQTHSRCNADCVFCPYAESHHAENPGVMPDELFEKVLQDLLPFAPHINKGKVCPYLMQEPLIDRRIFYKIQRIYELFPNTLVEVSTNGAALTDRVIDDMLSMMAPKRHEVWVSHHGINEETLRHIMKLDYNKATANLLNLIRRSAGRLKIKIRGAGTSRDGKIVYFTPEQYLQYWRDIFKAEKLDPRHVDVDAFTFHDRAGTLTRVDRDAHKMNIGKVREIGPGHKPFHCGRIDEWVHVMWDGTIRLCCMDYHGEVKLPSIKDMSFLDFFRSDAYRTLHAMVTGKIESPEHFICKRCISPGG